MHTGISTGDLTADPGVAGGGDERTATGAGDSTASLGTAGGDDARMGTTTNDSIAGPSMVSADPDPSYWSARRFWGASHRGTLSPLTL